MNSACKNSLLVTSTVKSLAVTAGHRGETLIMAEVRACSSRIGREILEVARRSLSRISPPLRQLCNSLLHGLVAKRFARLLVGVEGATEVASGCAFLGDVHVALTCRAGLEHLLMMLDEEADMKESIVQAEEVELRNRTV